MSAFSLKFEGLSELISDLRKLPTDLVGEAAPIVTHAGETAENRIRAAYPYRTGELRDHVSSTIESAGQFGVSIRITNSAKYASWYEFGTQARHYTTKAGALHSTGAAPPAPAGKKFIPVMEQERRRMYEELAGLLTRHGLEADNAAP